MADAVEKWNQKLAKTKLCDSIKQRRGRVNSWVVEAKIDCKKITFAIKTFSEKLALIWNFWEKETCIQWILLLQEW